VRRLIFIASGVLLLATLFMIRQENRRLKPLRLIPTITGQPEYCLTCHSDLPEISHSHPVKSFGCVLCHGGERLALEANLAHSTMRGADNPSDFSMVKTSCGGTNCHSGNAEYYRDHIQRATTSIQATYAGAIANIRYTFGAQPDLKARFGIIAIQDTLSISNINVLAVFNPIQETDPAIQAFARNCLECHLSAIPRSGTKYAHFTGCSACHTPTQTADRNINDTTSDNVHAFTTAISYAQCNTCHNRGNYDLRSMTFIERQDDPTDRLHDYYQPIAQFTRCEWTLDCIDCHTRNEVMGDGNLYSSKKDIQYIQCRTCHGTLTELPLNRTITDLDALAFRMSFLNPVIELKPGDTILFTEKGEPLWNIRVLPDGTYELFGKVGGHRFQFHPVKGSDCTQNPAQQDSASCHQCHSVER